MSFATAAGTAASSAFGSVANASTKLLRGANIPAMGRAVGVVVSAGVLAAAYQLMLDESRGLIRTVSAQRHRRYVHHERMLVELLGKGLTPEVQNRLLNTRDAFATALQMLADSKIAENDRNLLRAALTETSRIEA